MRIALFSDIHANLPALEAFFADVENRNVDALYCLGDLVGYNIWPNEIIQEIRKRNIATIAGNHDEAIGNMVNTQKEIDVSVLNNGSISKEFTNQLLTEDNRLFLQTLPRDIRLEFKFNTETIIVLLVHGSPNSINEYLFEERPKNELIEMTPVDINLEKTANLPEKYLVKVDRASMFSGVEVRSPFLDEQLLEKVKKSSPFILFTPFRKKLFLKILYFRIFGIKYFFSFFIHRNLFC